MTKTFGLAVFLCLASTGVAAAQEGRELITPMSIDASSTLKDKKGAYDPWHAIDLDVEAEGGDYASGATLYTTGWCEGAKGDGVGESLTISGNDVGFSTLAIAAGYWKSSKLFKANNQVTALKVHVTDHEGNVQSYDVSVPNGMEVAYLEVGHDVDATQVTIEIAGVKKGKVNDTCISNVVLSTGGGARKPFLDAAAAIDDLNTALFNLNDGLQACDANTLEAHMKFPLSYDPLPDPTGETKTKKVKFKKLKDFVKACKKGTTFYAPGDPDYTWLFSEGGGKVRYSVGGGNEYGSTTWHLAYEYNPDGFGGVWKLTKVDY